MCSTTLDRTLSTPYGAEGVHINWEALSPKRTHTETMVGDTWWHRTGALQTCSFCSPRSPVIGNRANCHSCGLVHLPTSCCCCCIYLHELTNKMCHAFGWSFAVTGVRAVRLSANMQMSMTKRTQSNITGLPDAYYTAACRLLFATAAAAVARIDTATPPKSENRDCTTFATKHTTYEIMYPNAFVMDTKQQIHT